MLDYVQNVVIRLSDKVDHSMNVNGWGGGGGGGEGHVHQPEESHTCLATGYGELHS